MTAYAALDLDPAQDHVTAPRCEAFTGWRYTDWDRVPVQCHQWKGLRTFFDGNGREHAFCAAVGHLHNVVRRFGVEASTDREAREHAKHDGDPDCRLCERAYQFYATYPA